MNNLFLDLRTSFYGKDKVIYASGKDAGVIIKRKHSWMHKSFLTVDVSLDGRLQNPVLLKGEVNIKIHQSTPAV